MTMTVSDAVATRRSVRGFLDTPVDDGLIREILNKAARAPSGGNLQPWHLFVVRGQKLAELKTWMQSRIQELPTGEPQEYDIYPKTLTEPYRSRRFQVGEGMYAAIGIPRDDKFARLMWFARNFNFFNAPLALFCYVDRNHGPPQWSDCGMYLQSLMLLLREAGLDSCPQECWAIYPQTVRTFTGALDSHMLFTGMSIGYKDPAEPANSFIPGRAVLEEFCTFVS
jgi:nitroreductase